MNYYFVDYENVRTQGLNGIRELTENDTVYIFYSEKMDTISIDNYFDIKNSNAHIEFEKVEVGTPNALDFQLSSYLGYFICKTEKTDAKYYIVAKDKGYGKVVTFWKDKEKVTVNLISNLKKEMEEIETDALVLEVRERLQGVADVNAKDIVAIMREQHMRSPINETLVKKYQSKEAKKIYDAIKSLIPRKGGIN